MDGMGWVGYLFSSSGSCRAACTMAVLEYRVWKYVHLDPCVHSSCTMAGVRLAHLPAFLEVCHFVNCKDELLNFAGTALSYTWPYSLPEGGWGS